MFVTKAVFHELMSSLKVDFEVKRSDMSGTLDVSQPEIAPCVPSAVAALARWSAQRGVPFIIDAHSGDCADAATALDFRLTNAQKVLVDAMEPPPREGGVRFSPKPPGIDFEWDDPFAGGVARPGLDLEKMNLAK